jgi:hypothetical protein
VPQEIRDRLAAKNGTAKNNANFAGVLSKTDLSDRPEYIKERRAEYERLRNDGSYVRVKFNERNGALYAEHRDHNFDPTVGIFGVPRGDYERIASKVLYDYGRCVILGSERSTRGIKVAEGFLDGTKFDIKGIEGRGKRNIEYKIYDASRQGAECVVLYYHDANLFSIQHITDGYNAYLRNSKSRRIQNVYYIVDGKLHKIEP